MIAEIVIPEWVGTVLVAATLAMTYVIRTLAAKKREPAEMARGTMLKMSEVQIDRLDRIIAIVERLPTACAECPFSSGRIPEHVERYKDSILMELENIRLRAQREHPRGEA